jgi:carbon monoxide dehydrogenase subunit G
MTIGISVPMYREELANLVDSRTFIRPVRQARQRADFRLNTKEMIMELVGEHTFNLPREQVWNMMLDPAVLKACLPGCEKLEAVGEDEYVATMKMGISFIKGTFSGKVKITDKNEPSSYTMHVEGSGPQGQVAGTGNLELVDQGDSTVVRYKGEANVRGSLARVGARMIQPAAKTIVGQFFDKMEKEGAALA